MMARRSIFRCRDWLNHLLPDYAMKAFARILLVEDDPADARLVLEALAEENLDRQTLTLSDGRQALDYLRARDRFQGRPTGNPAVVLADIKMPNVDGLELLSSIRSDPALCLIPVVMLTASRREDDVRRAYELGSNGYLLKTVGFESCMESLRAFGQFFAIANEPPPDLLT